MMWEVHWSFAALHGLRALHPTDAARVDRAVIQFATTGRGDLTLADDDPTGARLRAGSFIIYLTFNREERILWVRGLYRVR